MRTSTIAFVLLLVVQTAEAREPLTVGGVTARAGEKANGWIDVHAGSDAGTRIPVSVVHGARARGIELR